MKISDIERASHLAERLADAKSHYEAVRVMRDSATLSIAVGIPGEYGRTEIEVSAELLRPMLCERVGRIENELRAMGVEV